MASSQHSEYVLEDCEVPEAAELEALSPNDRCVLDTATDIMPTDCSLDLRMANDVIRT